MIALVTTTIYVPEVLRRYRELGPDVPFVIAGDQKSPHQEIERLCADLGDAYYLWPREQEEAWPSLSKAIGWNSIQRRNIAVLEALQLEPDLIVSIDDDNIPEADYFTKLEGMFDRQMALRAGGDWFNLGALAKQDYVYRGFPATVEPDAEVLRREEPCRAGIVNGLIYGDPDINARERIDRNPQVRSYGPQARTGIALDPARTWAPVNSQNTAYLSELAPLAMVLPRVGRYDDIWASYIAQAVLSGMDLHVLFGQPFVKQERNEHDLERDLADEIFGVENTPELVGFLRELELPDGGVLERLGAVLTALEFCPVPLPHDFFKAWLEACDRVGVKA